MGPIYCAVCLCLPPEELMWTAGHIPRWFTCSQTVTRPSTNVARHRITMLIETNASLPSNVHYNNNERKKQQPTCDRTELGRCCIWHRCRAGRHTDPELFAPTHRLLMPILAILTSSTTVKDRAVWIKPFTAQLLFQVSYLTEYLLTPDAAVSK